MEKPGIVMRFYRIERFFYVHHLKIFSSLFFRLIYLFFNCYIPPSAELKKGVKIAHGIGIVIHHRAVIGDNTKIFQNVTIGGSDEITIGENCLIGAGAVILGRVSIGDNVKIGANAFVNFDVPSGSTVVGVKGRFVA